MKLLVLLINKVKKQMNKEIYFLLDSVNGHMINVLHKDVLN